MSTRSNPFRRIRLVYCRTSTPVKLMILAALVASTVALLALTIGIRNAKAELEASRAEAAALEQQNAEIQKDIDGIGSVEGDKEAAEEELGLVDPDTVIFVTPDN